MKLIELASLYDTFDEDISDNYIDICIYICYEKNTKISEDFPYMDNFIKLLLEKTEIEKINGDVIICKFSKIIDDNLELFKEYIKKSWVDSMQWVLEEDAINHGEFHYEIIKDFGNVVNGNYGESVNKMYYELLKKCK